jgi:hypothetical protein
MRQSHPILKLCFATKGKLKECIVKGEQWIVSDNAMYLTNCTVLSCAAAHGKGHALLHWATLASQ